MNVNTLIFLQNTLGWKYRKPSSFLFMILLMLSWSQVGSQTYVNGPFITGTTNSNGTSAPAGYSWSELQPPQNTLGNNGTGGTFDLADDFTVPSGETWVLSQIRVFAYSTGYVGSTSPFTEGRIAIYNTDPSVGSPSPIFGDMTTNRLSGTGDALAYRIGTGSSTTNRLVWYLDLNTPTTLTAGTYWIRFNSSSSTGANWYVLKTIVGQSSTPGDNAMLYTVSSSTWSPLIDGGTNAPVDFPFIVNYTLAGPTGCTNTSSYGTVNAPTTSTPATIVTCMYAGEYNTINNCVAGNDYTFTATGGASNFITIHQGTPSGTILGSGPSPLTVTCTANGSLYLHLNTNASCGTDATCHTTTVACSSCAGPPDPCTSITPLTCGTATTASFSGTGLWSPSACGWTTPGQEKIYSFTPTASGTATLVVTSTNNGGYIDYQLKAASGGCTSSGWTCVDDIYSPGSFTFSVTGGVTYYLLLDPETTGSVTHTFRVDCPSSGCTPSISVTETSGTANDGTICAGSSATLTATAGSSYSWSTGATTQSITVSPTSTTTYSVTVTGGSCPGNASATITVNPVPTATAGSNSPVCVGSTIALTSSGGATYSWSGPGGWTSTLQNPTRTNATAAMAGTYTVTVTSAAGCTATATTDVEISALPSAVAKADPNPVCTGHFAQLFASGGVSYAWSGPNGFSSTQQNPGLGLAQSNMAGTYTVTVTNESGCSSTASVNLVVNNSPNGTASISTNFACVGSTVQLNASGGQNYLWRGPGGFISTLQNPVINVTSHVQGGEYWVTISNSNGCSQQFSFKLAVGYPPAATASHDQSTACTGSTLKLFGSGVGTYQWTGPAGFTSTQQNPVIANVTPANSGSYTLKVTATNGCSATAVTTVNVVAPPNLTAWADDYDICEFSTAYFHATGASNYEWNGPWGYYSTFQHPVLFYTPAYMSGTYTVTGTGPTGCAVNKSFDLRVYLDINGTISATPNPVQYGGTLQLLATGGTSYLWTGPNGFYSTQSDPVIYRINKNHAGVYAVIISNAGGCELTLFVNVQVINPKGGGDNLVTVTTTKIAEGKIYPNPANSQVTLQRHADAPTVYSIIDMQGRIVVKNATTDNGQINIEDLAPGVYNVMWSQPDVMGDAFNGRFVKVK